MAIIARARAMRKALTPSEARLWSALRGLRTDGLHFRRQALLRGYFLDFACIDRLVADEVDGASHDDEDRARKDRVRDAVLARQGWRTLRYTNLAVRDDLEDIVAEVRLYCLARPTRPARCAGHPPRDGEGEASL
ncbi:DUF559 domain-containing protein [Brevundimonas naejangsanensis]|uniref:DUF559 domain-containing protein n=1 Tax=Brevundimonas naejangsanensis TaxID=588932 RepID=A0A494RFH5_9CAUL|nr:DUF559 domain-containing protein [Brevundimonas naejangsanensis]AYG94179.1 DUF559 domain-containing protein [Brevundimonas naejangsanensis]